MQAIVVTFDRLATRLIGCYGNEWIETPNIDRLASMGTVFDNHFANSVDPACGPAWLTEGPANTSVAESTSSFFLRLKNAGVSSRILVSNCAQTMDWDKAGAEQLVHVAGVNGLDAQPVEVPFARLVQAATSLLRDRDSLSGNRLIWMHAPEPGLPPEGFATLYAEDFEERGCVLSEIPVEEWPRQIAVAAGSMSLVDHWLGELISQVSASRMGEPTLVLIASGCGRSWMETFLAAVPSSRSDCRANLLREQEIKSPLMMLVLADDQFQELSAIRCQRFVQPVDIVPTLLDWFDVAAEDDKLDGRSLLREAVSATPARAEIYFRDNDRSFGIRTVNWNCLVRLSCAGQAIPNDVCVGDEAWPEQVQLFSKPEDIWDVTDLATQQPEVCEELVRRLGAYFASRGTDKVT